GARGGIRKSWASACRKAGIKGARVHDLRHTYASLLASSGLSLPTIGSLLGHSQPATTHRYAHLLDESLRRGTELAAAVIRGGNFLCPAGVVRFLRARAEFYQRDLRAILSHSCTSRSWPGPSPLDIKQRRRKPSCRGLDSLCRSRWERAARGGPSRPTR